MTPPAWTGPRGSRAATWSAPATWPSPAVTSSNVPELARIVVQDSYHFVDPTGASHYLPSMNNLFLESYPGAIGIKTGFTDKAGSCIMAAARRQGRTMLAVVMNGYNPTQSAIDLLNEGFQTPVAAEPTNDRLPPPTLPGPVPLSTLSVHHPSSHHAALSPWPRRRAPRWAPPAPQSPRRAGPVAPGSGAGAIGGDGAAAPSRHGLARCSAHGPPRCCWYLAAARGSGRIVGAEVPAAAHTAAPALDGRDLPPGDGADEGHRRREAAPRTARGLLPAPRASLSSSRRPAPISLSTMPSAKRPSVSSTTVHVAPGWRCSPRYLPLRSQMVAPRAGPGPSPR